MGNTPQTAATGKDDRKTDRGWRIAFFVLLALNLGVAGMIGGAVLRHGPVRHGEMVRDLGFGPFTEALAPEDRAALRRSFLERAPDFRAARSEMRAEFSAVLAALRAEPFDAAALAAAMERQSSRMTRQMQLGQALLRDHLAEMTPDARRALADRLEHSLTRRDDRRH